MVKKLTPTTDKKLEEEMANLKVEMRLKTMKEKSKVIHFDSSKTSERVEVVPEHDDPVLITPRSTTKYSKEDGQASKRSSCTNSRSKTGSGSGKVDNAPKVTARSSCSETTNSRTPSGVAALPPRCPPRKECEAAAAVAAVAATAPNKEQQQQQVVKGDDAQQENHTVVPKNNIPEEPPMTTLPQPPSTALEFERGCIRLQDEMELLHEYVSQVDSDLYPRIFKESLSADIMRLVGKIICKAYMPNEPRVCMHGPGPAFFFCCFLEEF